MNHEIKTLPKSQVEIKITILADECNSFLEKAAQVISQNKKIPGFRPGKASLGAVRQHVGEDVLWNEMAELAMPSFLEKVILDEKVKIIGRPYYDVDKLKPNDDISFKAVISTYPSVKIGDYSQVKIKEKKIEIKPEEVDRVIKTLQQNRSSQAMVSREAKSGDKVEVSFELKVDEKLVDKQDKMPLVLGEGKFLKEFEDAVMGMSRNKKKDFEVPFPNDYHNKDLAGHKGSFSLNVLGVYKLALPELTDEFVKSIGDFKSVDDFKENVIKNLKFEAENKSRLELEMELSNKLVENSEIGEVPDVMINFEIENMIRHMEQTLSARGMKLEDYLKQVKKERKDLKLEYTAKAMENVRVSLVLRKLIEDEKLEVLDKEIESELENAKKHYQGNEEALKHVETQEYKENLRGQVLTKKAMDHLKKIMINSAS